MEMLISVRSAFCHESENGVFDLFMEYLDVGIIDSPFFFRAKRRSTRKRGQTGQRGRKLAKKHLGGGSVGCEGAAFCQSSCLPYLAFLVPAHFSSAFSL